MYVVWMYHTNNYFLVFYTYVTFVCLFKKHIANLHCGRYFYIHVVGTSFHAATAVTSQNTLYSVRVLIPSDPHRLLMSHDQLRPQHYNCLTQVK